MKIIPFLLLFLVFIGCNSPPIEPIDDKPPTEHTAPKEKQPDEKPVERREPPPIDKREVVPEDGGNEQTPDKPIPSCPANGLRITSINGTGSAREPSEVPSSLTDVRKATNRLQDRLVVTGSGLSKVSRVEIKELKTTLMMTVTKDTKMTLELTTALKLTKNTLYTLLFFLSTSSVCSAKVYLLQGEKGDSAGISQQESLQLKALLKNISASNDQVTIKADTFKVMNGDGSKNLFAIDVSKNLVRFEHVNVQITNGSQSTSQINGFGNLIIGYDKPTAKPSGGDKGGSHNIVVGDSHRYKSHSGFVSGQGNSILSVGTVAVGGQNNSVETQYSAVLGGTGNRAYGTFSVILGGKDNVTGEKGSSDYGNYSTITGGESNEAFADFSHISGGFKNDAGQNKLNNSKNDYGKYSSVLGGQFNKTYGAYSTISGGKSNITGDVSQLKGDFSSISGGSGNTASGSSSSISGGSGNTASGSSSSILGGKGNRVSIADFSILGGECVDVSNTQGNGCSPACKSTNKTYDTTGKTCN